MTTCTLLLVEDSKEMADATSELLEFMGHQVQHVFNATDAFKALSDKSFDLILMDIQLPVISGIEITKKIRNADSSISKIPIIALTSSVAPDDRNKFIHIGFNDYLAKPYTRKSLEIILGKWCEKAI
jgi:CheY-like chemotaxis protein